MPLIAHSSKSLTGALVGLALAASLAAGARPAAAAAPAAAAPVANPTPASAAGGTPQSGLRVAVIDTERILLSSVAGKAAIAALKVTQDAKEKELRGKQQEIKELEEKLAQGRLSLAQDKLADLQKQLEDREITMRRMSDDATRELNKKKDEMLGGIDSKVMPVINQIGKEQGYTLIFRKFESGLIYADEAIDITTSVIQRLDQAAAK